MHYQERALAAYQGLVGNKLVEPNSVFDVAVSHDDWCPILNGKGDCDCSYEMVITVYELGVAEPQVFEVLEDNTVVAKTH